MIVTAQSTKPDLVFINLRTLGASKGLKVAKRAARLGFRVTTVSTGHEENFKSFFLLTAYVEGFTCVTT